MWRKGYAIKTKNHVVVAMCIGVPVFLRHSVFVVTCILWRPCATDEGAVANDAIVWYDMKIPSLRRQRYSVVAGNSHSSTASCRGLEHFRRQHFAECSSYAERASVFRPSVVIRALNVELLDRLTFIEPFYTEFQSQIRRRSIEDVFM